MKTPLWYWRARCPSAVWWESSFNYKKKQYMIISEFKHYQCWKHRGKSSVESNIQQRELTDRGLLLSQVAWQSGHCISQKTHWDLVHPPGEDTPTCGNPVCSENSVISCSQHTAPANAPTTGSTGSLTSRKEPEYCQEPISILSELVCNGLTH